jgi:hypothetical protein
MASLPQLADVLRTILVASPEPVARSTGFCRRRSKLTAAVFVQALVLGWWQDPAATLRQLCQMAALRGVRISPQGLDQRFTEAGATLLKTCLEAALTRLVGPAARHAVTPLLARFPAITVLDSTTITLPDGLATIWPGCGGRVTTNTQAALKCTVAVDLRSGSLVGLDLTSGRTQDRATALQAAPVAKGALRIADQGFWSLPVFRRIAAGGGYVLSRYHSQTTVSLAGERLDLPRWLTPQAPVVDVAVTLGCKDPLPVRLLAIQVPPAVAAQRRRRIRADARSGGHPVPRQTLALAGWTVLVTNVPASLLTVAEAEVLRRLRWQIELVFKLWKQCGQVDTSRSANPWRILCEVYAKLLAMVLQHGVLLLGGGAFGTRSLVPAATTIRAVVVMLAHALDRPGRVRAVLRTIAALLQTVGAPNKRRNRPSAAQLLADPALVVA